MTTQVGIVEWAERIESARALEMQLAARSGAGCRGSRPAGAKLLLARHARHFAWHAELLGRRSCPCSTTARKGRRSPTSRLARARRRRSPRSPSRRPLYDDVLPLVVAAYRAWSGQATPIAERPVMRVLDLVLHDLDFDAQEGHDLFAAGLTGRPGEPFPESGLTRPVS